MKAPPDVVARLEQLRQSMDAVRLYALVDGVQYRAQFGQPCRLREGFYSLFAGTPDAALAHAGPWLIDAEHVDTTLVDALAALQARIAGLPVGAGFITEWMFGGVTFDGFDSSQCTLKEAKAKYDQFFDDYGDPQEWWKGDEPLLAEAARQSAVAKPMPPVQLRWYFMQSMSYRFFSKAFAAMRLPIETVFNP